jgi:tRNA(fMet)-specific endonuclease VapC
MKYVLDTNAVSALMKGESIVIHRLKGAGKENVTIPAPVFAELSYGIERLTHSKRKDALRGSYDSIRDEFACTHWSDDVSRQFGIVKAALERRGQRIEDFDAAIAAHALASDAVLVTTNLEHMARVPGLKIEDWAQPERDES